MDDRDRIREKIEAGDASREALAGVLGCSVASVGRLLRKERRLQANERDLAFRFLGIEGAQRVTPIIGRIAAGNWRAAIQEPMGFTKAFDKGGPNTFGLEVDGDSMDRFCPAGAIIAVDPDDRRLVDGGLYAVINDIDDATFKVFRSEPARLEPASHNSVHEPIYIGSDTVNVIGRIVQITYSP
jgi:repressor LexA